MMSKTQSGDRYWRMTTGAGGLVSQSTGNLVWQWFQIWRWPAGLVAGLVLWLALVAVVGAATRVGGSADYLNACRFDRSAYNANVIEMPCAGSIIRNADVVVGISAMRLWMCGTDCRPGLSPRP